MALPLEQIASRAASLDRDRTFPNENLAELAAAGAYGLVIATEFGGAGGALTTLAEACESIGAACASTAMVFLMHSVTAATIGAGGGAMASDVLRAMSEGKLLGTLAFSERGTGAHFYNPELKAEHINGEVKISGRKTFVTSAGHADVYLVLVQGEAEGTADAYLVRKDDHGVSFEGTWNGLGMAGNSSVAMDLKEVTMTKESLIGAPGAGLELVFNAVAPFFLVGLAAVNVGIASAAGSAASSHAASRKYPDGTSLAEVQYVQHLIADIDTKTRAARLLVKDAARLGEEGDPSALVAIMEAKVAATDTAAEVARLALLVTGGQGYTPALPVERHLRDSLAGAVMAPTNAVLKSWIGKALTGLPVP